MSHSFFIPKTETFLQLTRPLVFFDLETTGASVASDRIVEIFALKLHADGSQEEVHHYINPTIPIDPAATAVHGITDDMVKDKPTFAMLAAEMALFFQHCDLAGYNIKRFDVPLLMKEFFRCKIFPINYLDVKLVDVMGIFHSKEKRDLSAAVRFYCQREHSNAHSARADVEATLDILKRQLLLYDDLKPDTSFLHDYLQAGNRVDLDGKFVRDKDGKICFGFGMHRGKEACTELAYLKWMFKDGDFFVDTKQVAKRIYMHCLWENEIKAWIQTNKLTATTELASALYTAAKYSKNIFPFAVSASGEQLTITYLTEPPAAYTFVNADALALLLSLLDETLRLSTDKADNS